MNLFKYAFANIVETLLRVLPFPCKTGLVRIGNPGRDAPVFLTCNFHLTVERVKRALKGIDCYLLVANSRGINVWCGAAGGHFTNHDVISVLKVSGIEDAVDHRKVILPQLAASGIESRVIREKAGWHIIWGPVYARDIPQFLDNKLKKTAEASHVVFPLIQRFEMAIAWAFPVSIVLILLLLPFWRQVILPVTFLVWGLSFLLFLTFPLYGHILNTQGRRIGFIFFDFGRGGFQLLVWALFILGIIAYGIFTGGFSLGFVIRWTVISLVVVLLLSMDMMGSTPIYKSGLHEDRMLTVFLDEEKCKGAGFCELVCPRNCFEVDRDRHITTMPGAARCVRCGACIVQCPFDALYFKNSQGEIIPPGVIRRFKLNLMGKRFDGSHRKEVV